MSSKRTILITGCSDGSLGSVLALQFHKAGWRVFASEMTGGSLDAILNNVGAGYSMPLMDVNIAKARELFDLNVWSVLNVTRAFLPLLMESPHEYGGLVVNNTACASVTARTTPFSERSTFQDNAPAPVLPPTSLYNVTKETVEKAMSGANAANGADPEEWASQVVGDLSKRNPPHRIWRGKFEYLARGQKREETAMDQKRLAKQFKKVYGFWPTPHSEERL
ncbi:hypothetical protein BJY01DRAFT_232920 [Aspergillus pseudoustus]|uniref:NAD(P)-binding protein n=1 Tax=Aspergillus pseudoustus TaxID=1810923 RepID=A0ABR4KGT7_9EURO